MTKLQMRSHLLSEESSSFRYFSLLHFGICVEYDTGLKALSVGSDAGASPPESCVFGLLTFISAYAGTFPRVKTCSVTFHLFSFKQPWTFSKVEANFPNSLVTFPLYVKWKQSCLETQTAFSCVTRCCGKFNVWPLHSNSHHLFQIQVCREAESGDKTVETVSQ